jgi:hypothetical protein
MIIYIFNKNIKKSSLSSSWEIAHSIHKSHCPLYLTFFKQKKKLWVINLISKSPSPPLNFILFDLHFFNQSNFMKNIWLEDDKHINWICRNWRSKMNMNKVRSIGFAEIEDQRWIRIEWEASNTWCYCWMVYKRLWFEKLVKME